MRDELHPDSIGEDACDAAPSAAGADTTAAAAGPPKYIKGRLKPSGNSPAHQHGCSHGSQMGTRFLGERWVCHLLIPLPNQHGALRHHDFVIREIANLLARGSIVQTDRPSLVVKLLNVVERNSKLRLILDQVYVNHFIKKEGLKFKYEGIKLTSLYSPPPDDYIFSVDLEKA